MKNSFSLAFVIIFIILSFKTQSQTEKYRLSYRDDPATTVVIGWSGASASVCYDTIDHGIKWDQYSFQHGADRTTNYMGMNNYFARLTGLKPSKTYYFVVKSALVSERFYFKTLTDKWNNHDTICFVVGGDTRTGLPTEDDYQNCRLYRNDGNRLVAAIRPDFVAFGGDFVYQLPGIYTNEQDYKDWLDDWQHTKTYDGQLFPLAISFGNHEIGKDVYNLFDIPNEDDYYALNFGGNLFRLYCLSSEVDACDYVPQRNWLDNDLLIHSFNDYQPYWKIAQYHTPMHNNSTTATDASRQDMIDCWAPRFRTYKVNLAFENHAHFVKYTWPIVPSTAAGSDQGFIRDDNEGTVYVGDGSWGAPMKEFNDGYSWNRDKARIHGFHLVRVSVKEIQVRTVDFANANEVYPLPPRSYCKPLPKNLKIWNPSNGSVVILNKPNVISVEENKPLEKEVNIYPNPTTGIIHIDFSGMQHDRKIQLYNALGKLILEKTSDKNTSEESIDLNNKSKGIYYIYIKADDHFEMHKISLQ